MINPKTEYLMLRAQEEAVAALHAEHPSAAAAHQSLAVLYSAKAAIDLAAEVDADGPGEDNRDRARKSA